MKRVSLILLSIFLIQSCDVFENEQEQELEIPDPRCEESFFVVVEQMPQLIGGLADLQKSVIYPEEAVRRGIEGRVTVQFLVTETGNVICPNVIRGIGGGCDEAALNAVSNAKFEPGMQRGEPVRVQYSLPIVFRLQN
ncbi:MAG: energy transducer TonB [Balneolaceae bacterium]